MAFRILLCWVASKWKMVLNLASLLVLGANSSLIGFGFPLYSAFWIAESRISFLRCRIWSGPTWWSSPLCARGCLAPWPLCPLPLRFRVRCGLAFGDRYWGLLSRFGDAEGSSLASCRCVLMLNESFLCRSIPPEIPGDFGKLPVMLESSPSVVSSFSSSYRVISFWPDTVLVFFMKNVSFIASEWPAHSSDYRSFLSKAERSPSFPRPRPPNSSEVMPGESGPAAISVWTLCESIYKF